MIVSERARNRLEPLAQRLAKKQEPWRDRKIVPKLIALLTTLPARA